MDLILPQHRSRYQPVDHRMNMFVGTESGPVKLKVVSLRHFFFRCIFSHAIFHSVEAFVVPNSISKSKRPCRMSPSSSLQTSKVVFSILERLPNSLLDSSIELCPTFTSPTIVMSTTKTVLSWSQMAPLCFVCGTCKLALPKIERRRHSGECSVVRGKHPRRPLTGIFFSTTDVAGRHAFYDFARLCIHLIH